MKRRNVFFVMIMLLIMCLSGCGDSVDNDSFNDDYNESTEENTEDKEISDEERLENIIPYLPMSNRMLGKKLEDHQNTSTDLLVSMDETGWSSSYFLVDDEYIYYYSDSEQKYSLGVKDEIITAVIYPATMIGTDTQEKEVLNVDGSDLCPPYVSMFRVNFSHYFWRVDGGYLIMGVFDVTDNYLENYVNDMVFVSDAEYHEILSAIIQMEKEEDSEDVSVQLEDEGNKEDNENYQNEEGNDTSTDYSDNSETNEYTDNNAEYYLNSQGILVDKVEEFETQTFGEYVVKYPILNEGVDEVVVYEFDTYDNIHVVLDASNVYQQTNLDEIGDYGDVQLEQIAPGRDVVYMFDGERYYIEDYTINLLTISKPINDN